MNFQRYMMKIRTMLGYKVYTTLIYCLLAVVLLGIFYHHVKPEIYEMELFSVADKTIRSPKTIEDEVKTQEERERAANEVEKQFTFNKEMAQNRVSLINSIFDFVAETNQELEHAFKNKTEADPDSAQTRLQILKTKLSENVSEDITDTISDQVFASMLQAEPELLQTMKETIIVDVEVIMNEKIREDQVDQAKRTIEAKMRERELPSNMLNAAVELGKYAVVANELYDPELTEERKKQAMEEVEPVRVLQGQIVAQEGHLIDRETYRQLQLLGLLKNNPTLKPLAGLLIFIIVAIGMIYLHLLSVKISKEKKQNYLLLVSLIFISSLIVMKLVGLLENLVMNEIAYLFPAAMAPMLIKTLMNERLALMMTMIMAACGSIVFHDGITGVIDVEIAVYILFSGLSGVLFLSGRNERSHILRSGLFVSGMNILLIFFLILIGSGQYTTTEYAYYVLYGIISGVLSAVLATGLLPFFEAGFGILSTMRLIELSNPNHPLLKKILTETPGTYQHSVMVANLAESACEAIGANGLLARVGCYYHDIGKTRRPHFFIENQMSMENPHNWLSPETSKDIIIAHVADGVSELKEYKFPKEIIDIAEQHHGTSLLKFFYIKAKEENEQAVEENYRYPGPKPQTKEAAVISLADSVEAAVRSMAQPTTEQIKALVHTIVQDKILDGQFTECDLTLKEIEMVKDIFCKTLNGVFHSRIEYPDFKQQKVASGDAAN